MTFRLDGRAALITGANQGLGATIARAFVAAGADVLLCARDAALLERQRRDLQSLAGPGRQVLAMVADVSRVEDVNGLAARALQEFPQVHVLVNNAGIYGPKGPSEDVDWQEWVRAVEINLMGSVLMCRALLPHMKQRRYGKIIQISGGGAAKPLARISAYAASKAAVVRFAESVAEEVREFGIDINSVAPGALNTRMLDEVLAVGEAGVGADFYQRACKQKETGGDSLETAAAACVFLASQASDGITGKLISAVWDDWEHWPEHSNELRASDVYTLRRIAGRDRGYSWGDK